jgi:hypothetical protein
MMIGKLVIGKKSGNPAAPTKLMSTTGISDTSN